MKLTQDDINLWNRYMKSLNSNPINCSIQLANRSYTCILDLHGMTIQHAHIEVKAFLRFHREEKTKSVRIITGKSGKIKKEFIFWIESEPYIRKIEPIYDSRKQVGSFQIFLKKISKTY